MKARDGGGVLITQAIHTLDLFQSLTGPIAKVTAFAKTSPLRKIDTEDIACGAIEFANGAIGTIDATTVAYPGFPERIELAGEKGTAVLNAETLDLYFKDGRHVHHEGAVSKSGGADPMAFSNDAHKALIVDFLDAIDQYREPTVSGRESLKVMRLIEALLRSASEGKPVSVGESLLCAPTCAARSACSRAASRRYRAGAGGRSSASGPRSFPSTARSSRRCARPRTAR